MKVLHVLEIINSHDIILASGSPRRQHLLRETGIRFRIAEGIEIDETYPPALNKQEIPMYLARKKASHYHNQVQAGSILITADTIVWFDNGILPKPSDLNEAREMLKLLSGQMHEVFTGINIKSNLSETGFYSRTCVYFKDLSDDVINHYVDHFMPLDKAGAYGIQEWIGIVGVKKIEGCYYNVMGLPVQQLFDELVKFIM